MYDPSSIFGTILPKKMIAPLFHDFDLEHKNDIGDKLNWKTQISNSLV